LTPARPPHGWPRPAGWSLAKREEDPPPASCRSGVTALASRKPGHGRDGLRELVAETTADELMMFGTALYDTEARLRSYEIVAEIAKEPIALPLTVLSSS
jgi:hypothetical protein